MLGLGGRLAHGEDGGGRGHRVTDSDHRFLGDPGMVRFDGGKDGRAEEGEHQAGPIGARAVGVKTVKHSDGGAERGDLGQREIHEYNPSLDYMNTQVGVYASQDQAGDERREQEAKSAHVVLISFWRRRWSTG